MKICLVLPVYNEEKGIQAFLLALMDYLKTLKEIDFSLLIVNDGSTDSTPVILKNITAHIPIEVVHFSRNFGKEAAISAGLALATGDAVIIMDADFQHPFHLISVLIKAWREEGYDMAYTVRANRDDESFIKRLFTRIFYKLINTSRGPKLPVHAGDFRLLTRKVVDAILACPEHVRFMKGMYAWVGFKTKAISYQVEARRFGKSKWPFYKLLLLATEGITNFTDFPLRVWTVIGLVIALLSIIYALVNVITTLIFGVDIPGYPTLVCAILFLGGVQLISIGVIGEYLSNIFREVKGRPTYIIESIEKHPPIK